MVHGGWAALCCLAEDSVPGIPLPCPPPLPRPSGLCHLVTAHVGGHFPCPFGARASVSTRDTRPRAEGICSGIVYLPPPRRDFQGDLSVENHHLEIGWVPTVPE